jgi:hypothetical protein
VHLLQRVAQIEELAARGVNVIMQQRVATQPRAFAARRLGILEFHFENLS